MKSRNASFLAALIVFIGSCVVFGQSSDEKEVRALERAWLDAYEQRDVKAMNEIVADEFAIVFPGGSKQTKAGIIESLKKPPRNAAISIKHRTEDVKAEVLGDKVILRGRVISDVVRDGTVMSSEESLYVDTYVRRGGRWQVVDSKLTHSGPKPEVKKASPPQEGTESVQKTIEKQYAKLADALKRKDYAGFISLRTADFSTRPVSGGPQNADQMAARTRLLLEVIQPPINVSFEIVKLSVKGDEAIATVRQIFSRMQNTGGQLRKLETGVTQDETWIRTPEGWKLRYVANECDLVRILDDKPTDVDAHYGVKTPRCSS